MHLVSWQLTARARCKLYSGHQQQQFSTMSAKGFLKNLATQISQDLSTAPSLEELRSSFKEAVDSLPKGKLRKSLRSDFETQIDSLNRKISKKLKLHTEVPAPFEPDNEENLSELSTLDERPDVREPGSPQHNKPIFCVVGKVQPPDFSRYKDLTKQQKYSILCAFIKVVLDRADADDDSILDYLRQLEELSEREEEETRSKFDWLFRLDTLLRLTTGHTDSKVLVRFLRILFREITSDVEKIVDKRKSARAGRVLEILHRYLMSSHMKKEFTVTLKEEDKKPYSDLMSALLAYFVDLKLVHACKVTKKKAEGRQLCGLVAYWLKDYPESLLELVLQLYGPMEENKNVIMPLVGKSLEKKPVSNSHYLKYVLVVKTMTQKLGEEVMYDYIIKARLLSCNKDFLDWLNEICPEVHEEMPTNDRKFKGTHVTKFLLDDTDDNMVSMLLDSLRDSDNELPVPSDEDNEFQKVLDLLNKKDDAGSDQLFFIDKGGSSEKMEESKPSGSGVTDSDKSIIVLNQEEIEDLLDVSDAKPFKIDTHLIRDDNSDKEFFDSEIISIKTYNQRAEEKDKTVAPVNGHVLIEDTDIDKEDHDAEVIDLEAAESESDSVTVVTETEEEREIERKAESQPKLEKEESPQENREKKKSKKEKKECQSDNLKLKKASLSDVDIAILNDESPSSCKPTSPKETKGKRKKRKSSAEKKEMEEKESVEIESQKALNMSCEISDTNIQIKKSPRKSETTKAKLQKEQEEYHSSVSETDRSFREDDQISLETTMECDAASVTSSKVVEMDTESFEISKSDLSKSDVFSTEGEVTVVHLGEKRNIITDNTTDSDNLSDSVFDKHQIDKKEKADKKKKKSHSSGSEETVRGKSKRTSKSSKSSINSQDTSQQESELDKTEKYVDGNPYKSPFNDAKSERKFSNNDEERKDESISEPAITKQSKRKPKDSDACIEIEKADYKKSASPPSKSFEKKFVAKALKKTPKKPTEVETDRKESSEKKKHKHRKSKDSPEEKKDHESSAYEEIGKKRHKNSDLDDNDLEKGAQAADENKGDSPHVPEGEETQKKSGRLTPQKMFEILNDVKQIDNTSGNLESHDDKSERGLSEYESESCIEIASESQDESEQTGKNQFKQEQDASADKILKFESEPGSDKNDSAASVIDLVSENDDKNNDMFENRQSDSENLEKSDTHFTLEKSLTMVDSAVKSPKEDLATQNVYQDQGSPADASRGKSPASSKKQDFKSPTERRVSENKAETADVSSDQKLMKIISPKQKPAMMEEPRMEDHEERKSTEAVSPRHGKSNGRLSNDKKSVEDENSGLLTSAFDSKEDNKCISPEKPKSPEKNQKSSTLSELEDDQYSESDNTAAFGWKKAPKPPPNTPVSSSRKSPRIRMHEKRDTSISDSEQNEILQSQHKSPRHLKSPGADSDLVVHKEFSDKEYTPGKRSNLRSSDNEKSINKTPNTKIPSSHKKIIKDKTSPGTKLGESKLDTESESDIENLPNLSQHLKSPQIPLFSDETKSVVGPEVNDTEKVKAASNESELESDRVESSPIKKQRLSKKSKTDKEKSAEKQLQSSMSDESVSEKQRSSNDTEKEKAASSESELESDRVESFPKKKQRLSKKSKTDKEKSAEKQLQSSMSDESVSEKQRSSNDTEKEKAASSESELEPDSVESSPKKKETLSKKSKTAKKQLQSSMSDESVSENQRSSNDTEKEKAASNESELESDRVVASPKRKERLSKKSKTAKKQLQSSMNDESVGEKEQGSSAEKQLQSSVCDESVSEKPGSSKLTGGDEEKSPEKLLESPVRDDKSFDMGQGSSIKTKIDKNKSPGKHVKSPVRDELSAKQEGCLFNKTPEEEGNEKALSPTKKERSIIHTSDADVFDFHSETEHSDGEEEKQRKSPKVTKSAEEPEETVKKQSSSRRRTIDMSSQDDRKSYIDITHAKARSKSMGVIAERNEASDDVSDEAEKDSAASKEHRKAESPMKKSLRRGKGKETEDEENTAVHGEPDTRKVKVAQKRKSVSYIGLKEKYSETEDTEPKKTTPPRRRSERKALTSKKSTPPRRHSEAKVSASTSKKKPVQKKVEEMRKPRKRRLSGELSRSESESVLDDSEDSEVSFPKQKRVTEAKPSEVQKPKRSSTRSTAKEKTSKSPKKSKSPAKQLGDRKSCLDQQIDQATQNASFIHSTLLKLKQIKEELDRETRNLQVLPLNEYESSYNSQGQNVDGNLMSGLEEEDFEQSEHIKPTSSNSEELFNRMKDSKITNGSGAVEAESIEIDTDTLAQNSLYPRSAGYSFHHPTATQEIFMRNTTPNHGCAKQAESPSRTPSSGHACPQKVRHSKSVSSFPSSSNTSEMPRQFIKNITSSPVCSDSGNCKENQVSVEVYSNHTRYPHRFQASSSPWSDQVSTAACFSSQSPPHGLQASSPWSVAKKLINAGIVIGKSLSCPSKRSQQWNDENYTSLVPKRSRKKIDPESRSFREPGIGSGRKPHGTPVTRSKSVNDDSLETNIESSHASPGQTYVRWTKEETEDFYKLVEVFGVGRWAQIRDCMKTSRTNIQLKDKWRTMTQSGEDERIRYSLRKK